MPKLWGLGVELSDDARNKLVIKQQYDEQVTGRGLHVMCTAHLLRMPERQKRPGA